MSPLSDEIEAGGSRTAGPASGWSVRIETWPRAALRPSRPERASPGDLVDTLAEGAGSASCFRARIEAPSLIPQVLVVEGVIEGAESGFAPAVLVAEDAARVFVGAAQEARCYVLDATGWHLEWQRRTEVGFWRWARHGDIVLMLAELEIVAWDATGVFRWTMAVEPPYSYRVEAGVIEATTDGRTTRFPIDRGPGEESGSTPPPGA